MLRVSRILNSTEAEGPGRRTAVWFQGCSIRCEGCINPQLFSKFGGFNIDVNEVVRSAVSAGDEGLTLLGGEPFDQHESLIELSLAAQEAGLGVICFTGYEYETLKKQLEFIDLFDSIDLLVDGPYLMSSPESSRPLVGSTNQRFIHLSDRYKGEVLQHQKNRLEFRISSTGTAEVAGFLSQQQLSDLSSETKSIRRKRVSKDSL